MAWLAGHNPESPFHYSLLVNATQKRGGGTRIHKPPSPPTTPVSFTCLLCIPGAYLPSPFDTRSPFLFLQLLGTIKERNPHSGWCKSLMLRRRRSPVRHSLAPSKCHGRSWHKGTWNPDTHSFRCICIPDWFGTGCDFVYLNR